MMIRMCHDRLPQKTLAVVGVVGEPSVEIERDRAFRNVESEVAERAIVVFPAAVFLFKIARSKASSTASRRDISSAVSSSHPDCGSVE